ncbi:MAG: SDR family NAD(P)-dependent oxidoreductase [Bacteroidetes bacterium]|nr:SDR family NAD(P)-dependent oxidoreductase [Bacteroidota bacterium]
MKKAIVVGATSGIGKGIAQILVDNDYKVGITGRRLNLLEDLKKENPDKYFLKCFDVADTKNISKYLNELTQELSGLDLIVISSGNGDLDEELDFEVEKKTIDVNVTGFTALADWSFNYFKQQKFGHLVAITSIAGLRGNRITPSYSASKAFQMIYLEGLRQKSRKLKYQINITDIRPGLVDTDMAKAEVKFWIASVNKASKQIFKAIKRKRKIVYITKRWILIAVVAKVLPNYIYERIY